MESLYFITIIIFIVNISFFIGFACLLIWWIDEVLGSVSMLGDFKNWQI